MERTVIQLREQCVSEDIGELTAVFFPFITI